MDNSPNIVQSKSCKWDLLNTCGKKADNLVGFKLNLHFQGQPQIMPFTSIN